MKPDEVPEEFVQLYNRCVRSRRTPEKALAMILSLYEKRYSEKMRAFWQVWDNGWAALDEPPSAAVGTGGGLGASPSKDPEVRQRRIRANGKKIRVTSQVDGSVKIYPSVKQAAEGENLSPTTVRAKLKGQYNKHRRFYEPLFEFVEEGTLEKKTTPPPGESSSGAQ